MHKPILMSLAFVLAVAGFLTYFAFNPGSGEAGGQATIASARGVVSRPDGDLFVDVVVLVPAGVSTHAATNAALAAQGARPATDLASANYTTTGLVWDQFSDANPNNNFVTQYYNPSGQPLDGASALTNSENTWTNVATSAFAFSYGGTTSRCPSLVQECSGPQVYDGFNDVTFLSINGPCSAATGCTLGVTWSSSSNDEADMALNTKVAWVHDCNATSAIDVESVMLHENGHVVGLGHSTVAGSVMAAYYGGAQCTLGADDIAGISALYPVAGGPTATPTDTPTNTPLPPTATNTPTGPTPTPTDTPSSSCPPGWQKHNRC